MQRTLIVLGALVAALLAAPSSAGACASDQTSYLDSFPDATCLLLGAGTEIDADGGLRLKTGGATTAAVWDTPAQFDNPPTGDDGSLRVYGDGTAAYLGLEGSALPLTPVAPPLSPTGAELTAGPTQVRDSEGVEDPSVIRVGTKYVMYYTGYAEDGSPPAIFRVESEDGRTWTRPPVVGSDPNPVPVLSAGAPGSFDANGVFGADVVHDAGDAVAPYRMYYSGVSPDLRAIGYATSTDGITWTKRSTPVLLPGLPGTRDAFAVANPSVIKDGDLYKMWYEGDDSTFKAIGYATSVDGVTWERAGLPSTLQQDPLGGGDPKIRFGIYAPTVWKTATGYKMLFVGRNANDPTATRLLGATSADGIDWTLGGPEINPQSGRFYATNFYSPDVMLDPADAAAPVKLYFAGDRAQAAPADDRARIGLATANSDNGAFGVYTGGADPLEAVYNPGPDSTRFDARNVLGLSVADAGGDNDWVGAYAGTRSREAGGPRPRLGIATYDPTAATPVWTKRDGAQADKSILPLGAAAEDAAGQRDPSLVYRQGAGPLDDWWLFYTALPSDGSNPGVRLASSDEDTVINERRPTTWTKTALVIPNASHPSALRQAATEPVRVYHTVEDGTPTSMAMSASTTDDALEGPYGAPVPLTFTGPDNCDAEGQLDPVVIEIGTTLHMLYTGIDGDAEKVCYATADTTVSYTTFARQGRVMPDGSDVPYAYDERANQPASMFVDAETAGAPLNVYFTGTDRGERRFTDALGNTGVFDQRTRVGRATSPMPITYGRLPSGTATGQVGTPDGPLIDFRKITRVKTGNVVEMQMSVLQPYSSPTDPAKQYWSDWFPVIESAEDTASQDLTFGFGVRAARWRARLSNPSGSPKLDSVTVESGPLQFEPAGTATTTDIAPPEGFVLGSWGNVIIDAETFTFPGATATTPSGTVTVLGAGDAPVVAATPLTLTAGAEQTIPISSVPAAANPKLKVKFDLASSGATPQTTPLVKQLRVTYTSAKGEAPPVDGDGDGVPDAQDACPAVAAPGQANGCPPPDADGDGVPDAQDACPTVAAAGQAGGCPPDADKDGVPDATDACPTVAAAGSPNGCPLALTLAALKTKIVFGRTTSLSGTLLRGALPVPGQMVTISSQPIGTTAPKVLGTAVTDVAGRWVLTVKPTRHTTYSVALASVASPSPVTVQVAHALSLKVALSGRLATFTGKLGPRHARRTVTIQRKSGTGWSRVARVRTTRRSTFRFAKRFARGRHSFRVITGKDAQHLGGRSAVRRVRVR